MGGRGAASGLVSGTKLEYGGRSMSIFKFLNQDDIRRANDASITDMGDIIKRMFLSNSGEKRAGACIGSNISRQFWKIGNYS